MRIAVKKTKRKSIAYSLAPEELTILLPNDVEVNSQLERALSAVNGNFESTQTMNADEFHQLLDNWIERLQVKPNKVQLKKMKSKWASCSPSKNVTFNTSLTFMPREFVGYVICHELLHFKVPNHNKLFRNLLSAYMPDWRERIQQTIDFVLAQNSRERSQEVVD